VNPLLAVIDTNVVVSGLLTGSADAPTAQILSGMLAGRFPYLLSLELLSEYRRVLLRPKVQRHHKLTDLEVEQILVDLCANGILRNPPPAAMPAPDPGDSHVWALLAAYPGTLLVTGDQALLESPLQRGSVLSPRDFLDLCPPTAQSSKGSP
jgi:putative PIN family toxin of toxin-antitoxin system